MMNKADLRKSLERASHCLDENELDEAATLCTAVLHAAPRNARAFHLRAIASQRRGRGKEATEDAVHAANLRPDLPALQVAAGSLLCREKLYDRALELYEAALRRDPGNAQYHLGAASALRKLGRGQHATSALRKAAAAAAATASPSDRGVQAHAQYKLGQHLRSTGEPQEAAEAYARCLGLDPGHVLAAFWLTATRKLAASAAREPQRGDTSSSSSNADDANSGSYEGHERSGSPPSARTKTATAENTLETPVAAPREYVVGLYNAYAETFDSHLQESLAYKTPTVIVETLRVLFPGRRWNRCLDLGAGTGLSGQAASAICDQIVGVDLSPAMVRQARQKRVYHRLLVGDVTETVERLCRESRENISSPSSSVAKAESRASATSGKLPGFSSGSGLSSGCPSSGVEKRRWEVPATAEEEGGAVVGESGRGGGGSCHECCRMGTTGEGLESSARAQGEGEGGAAATEAAAREVAARAGGPTRLTGCGGVETEMPTRPPSEVASSHAPCSDAPAATSSSTITITTAHTGARSSIKVSNAGGSGGELVLSCDVFGYIGDLRGCFKAVRELLMIGESCSPAAERQTTSTMTTMSNKTEREPAPVFAFSAEAPPIVVAADTAGRLGTEEGEAGGADGRSRPGYELQGTGRYSHRREYLERVCRETGFRILVADEVVLRKNAGVPVKGFVFVTEAVSPSAPAS